MITRFKGVAVLTASVLLGISLSTEASLEIPNASEENTSGRIVEHTTCAGFGADIIEKIDHNEELRRAFFKELSDGLIKSMDDRIYIDEVRRSGKREICIRYQENIGNDPSDPETDSV